MDSELKIDSQIPSGWRTEYGHEEGWAILYC